MKKTGRRMTAGMLAAFILCGAVFVRPMLAAAEGEDQPVYHAAMGIQTATQIWIQRWGYYDDSQNEYYGTEDYDKLYDSQKKFYDGTFEDIEIRGNGTYAVTLKDADFAGETTISQLHIATDIPAAESEKLQFTDVKLEINGNEILQFDQAVMEDEEDYTQGGAVILLFNHWRDELIKTLSGMGKSEDASNGWELLQGSGAENVTVTFTVSGLPYDNEESQKQEKTKESGAVLTAPKGDVTNRNNADAASIEDDTLSVKQIVGIVGMSVIMVAIVIAVLYRKSRKGN